MRGVIFHEITVNGWLRLGASARRKPALHIRPCAEREPNSGTYGGSNKPGKAQTGEPPSVFGQDCRLKDIDCVAMILVEEVSTPAAASTRK